VTLQGDHWVALIDRALQDVAPGMGVDIGQNAQPFLLAEFPQGSMAHGVKRDGTSFVGIGVEIVITDEGSYPVANAAPRRQQECSAFATSPSPKSQVKDQPPPECDPNVYARMCVIRGQCRPPTLILGMHQANILHMQKISKDMNDPLDMHAAGNREARRLRGTSSQPEVGVIFVRENDLWIDGTPVSDAVDHGALKTHEKGHDAFWEQLHVCHSVPMDEEYDEVPRGRACYDTKKRVFFLFLDGCILNNKPMVERIIRAMHPPRARPPRSVWIPLQVPQLHAGAQFEWGPSRS